LFSLTIPFHQVTAYILLQDKGDITDLKQGRSLRDYESGIRHKIPRLDSIDQFSGEEDISD